MLIEFNLNLSLFNSCCSNDPCARISCSCSFTIRKTTDEINDELQSHCGMELPTRLSYSLLKEKNVIFAFNFTGENIGGLSLHSLCFLTFILPISGHPFFFSEPFPPLYVFPFHL